MRNVSCLGFSAFLVVGVVTAQAQSKSAEPRVVRYHTTMADVKYVTTVRLSNSHIDVTVCNAAA
jgi:hypothetical protein